MLSGGFEQRWNVIPLAKCSLASLPPRSRFTQFGEEKMSRNFASYDVVPKSISCDFSLGIPNTRRDNSPEGVFRYGSVAIAEKSLAVARERESFETLSRARAPFSLRPCKGSVALKNRIASRCRFARPLNAPLQRSHTITYATFPAPSTATP